MVCFSTLLKKFQLCYSKAYCCKISSRQLKFVASLVFFLHSRFIWRKTAYLQTKLLITRLLMKNIILPQKVILKIQIQQYFHLQITVSALYNVLITYGLSREHGPSFNYLLAISVRMCELFSLLLCFHRIGTTVGKKWRSLPE